MCDRATAGPICHCTSAGPVCDSTATGPRCPYSTGGGRLEAAIIASRRRTGVLLTKTLARRRIAISDTLPVDGIVLPGIGGNRGSVRVDLVEPIDVDVDRASAPVRAAPAPKPAGDRDTGAKGEASRQAGGEAIARRRRIVIRRIVRIGPSAVGDTGV